MRIISSDKIKDTIADLCIQANLVLRKDILSALKIAYSKETSKRAKDIVAAIIKNADIGDAYGCWGTAWDWTMGSWEDKA